MFFHVDLQLSNDATLTSFIESMAYHSRSVRRMFRGSDGGWNSGRTGSVGSEVLRGGVRFACIFILYVHVNVGISLLMLTDYTSAIEIESR